MITLDTKSERKVKDVIKVLRQKDDMFSMNETSFVDYCIDFYIKHLKSKRRI